VASSRSSRRPTSLPYLTALRSLIDVSLPVLLLLVSSGVAIVRPFARVRDEDERRLATVGGYRPGMSEDPKLVTIRQIAITVSDVETALTFYRDVLGLTFLFRAGPDLAFLDAGGVRLMLTIPQGTGAVGHNSILYFATSDVEVTHATLIARGARSERAPQMTAKMPDHELWTGFLRDPDGNLVGLMEERR
jgi:catechol 2,3-dioxygenase-like lactoylglutathione lyase family enzyme